MATLEFKHERLALSGSFMRLLQIQGGTKKDLISLRITQFAIHRRPSYVAISYTWGPHNSPTREIQVNGRPFRVRINLWNLLSHLRQRGESRFLWIDALCIDQKNLEERNFHVQLMRSIYDRAGTAIVWLGLPSEDRRQARAMDFVGEMASFNQKHTSSRFRDTYLVESCAHRWQNLVSLCRGTYWTRTWIIQEFLQSVQIEVMCGTAILTWTNFEDVVRVLRDLLSNSQVSLPAFVPGFMQTLPVRLTVRRIFHTHSTLQELILEFYDSRCAERRDKIYGILGIADDCGEDPATGGSRGPVPDYSKHIIDVYLEVFWYLHHASTTVGQFSLQALCLTQQSLGLGEVDILSYASLLAENDQVPLEALDVCLAGHTKPIRPSYVNIISKVLPGWSSIRDLRRRLEQVDWSNYVGHEVRRKSARPSLSATSSYQSQTMPLATSPGATASTRPSSTLVNVRAPLPSDLLENVFHAAEHAEDLQSLYNYPTSEAGSVPMSHILLEPHDKCSYNNQNMTKPSIIIETNPSKGIHPVRIGFACTDVRVGDVICQFEGMEQTIIARRGHGDLKLVGMARMVRHGQLQEKGFHPGCRASAEGLWSGCVSWSPDASAVVGDGSDVLDTPWALQIDPVSLWELLRRSR